MKAVTWCGKDTLKVEDVDDPKIVNPRDAIVRVTSTTVCGSDIHLFGGYIPSIQPGDVVGHEFMGLIVELGSGVTNLQRGDRVVVPCTIACGDCFFCKQQLFSLCDNSNPNAWMAEGLFGFSGSAIIGYSHAFGGYAGSFAEYVRVPYADNGPLKVPKDRFTDEQLLFISDAFPTGFMAADFCDIKPGDTIAVWGCGAVGLFAQISAKLLGAERVIAIDRFPERLRLAREKCGSDTINYEEQRDVVEVLKEMTAGRGPDACIDAVGLEADSQGLDDVFDRAMQTMRTSFDRVHVLREAIQSCRKGGILSIVGVYSGFPDKLPMGAAMNKGLTFKMGQMHAQRYIGRLLEYVEQGKVDPSFVASHTFPLHDAQRAYKMFKNKQDGIIRPVLKPHLQVERPVSGDYMPNAGA